MKSREDLNIIQEIEKLLFKFLRKHENALELEKKFHNLKFCLLTQIFGRSHSFCDRRSVEVNRILKK